MYLDDFQVAQKKCIAAKTRKIWKKKVMKNSDSAGIIILYL